MISRPVLIAALVGNILMAANVTKVLAAETAAAKGAGAEPPAESLRAIQRYYYGDGNDVFVIQSDWLFDPPDSIEFLPTAEVVLTSIGEIISKSGDHPVTIEGHVEPIGSIERCQEISQVRAAKVAAWLKQHNYLPSAFYVQGYGKSHPLVNNNLLNGQMNPKAGKYNRRIEVIIDTRRTVSQAADERQKLLNVNHSLEEQSKWTAPTERTVIPGVRKLSSEQEKNNAGKTLEEKLKWSAPPTPTAIPAVPQHSEQAEAVSKKSLDEQLQWTAPTPRTVIPAVPKRED